MDAAIVYKWLKNKLSVLLPPVCRLCGDAGDQGRELCAGCELDLPWIPVSCQRCGLPLPETLADEAICGRCLRRPPTFDAVVAPFRYSAPIDRMIHAFKFRGDLAAGRLLADLLHAAVSERRPELLLPVPLHPRRIRKRGYNQALELARQVGRRLDIDVAPNLLFRTRDTPPQHEMPAKARRGNIRGAFALRRPLPVRHVAVIDDVLTTGHTASEIARTLRRAGAEHVEIWVLARA